jgi:AraC-like DNA-binding protein
MTGGDIMSTSGISEERLSDSSYVERVWYGVAEQSGEFTAPADGRWELIVKKLDHQISFVVSGPVSRPVASSFSEGMSILSIKFKLGTFMPDFSFAQLLNARIMLPQARQDSFWLKGRAWQFPDYNNADTFVDWLMREELLCSDPLIQGVMQDQPHDWSVHTVRRRFQKATGFTQSTLRQIERARFAAELLTRGTSILDTTFEAGYFDQPHLTRSLKHYIGQTPAQMSRLNQFE